MQQVAWVRGGQRGHGVAAGPGKRSPYDLFSPHPEITSRRLETLSGLLADEGASECAGTVRRRAHAAGPPAAPRAASPMAWGELPCRGRNWMRTTFGEGSMKRPIFGCRWSMSRENTPFVALCWTFFPAAPRRRSGSSSLTGRSNRSAGSVPPRSAAPENWIRSGSCPHANCPWTRTVSKPSGNGSGGGFRKTRRARRFSESWARGWLRRERRTTCRCSSSRPRPLWDYLPPDSAVVLLPGAATALESDWEATSERFRQRDGDLEQPCLPPEELFRASGPAQGRRGGPPQRRVPARSAGGHRRGGQLAGKSMRARRRWCRSTRSDEHTSLEAYAQTPGRRILLAAETAGQRELLRELLRGQAAQGAGRRVLERFPGFRRGRCAWPKARWITGLFSATA